MRTLWQVILHKPSSRSDAALLHSFVESKSEEAFSALVERHGGMVLGVCQRVLGHSQDAEDSFQATFLVLAQKAARLHGNSSLGPWLYGVAQRVAMKARSKRPTHAPFEEEFAAAPEEHVMNGEELRPIIDEEIARLPDHYRSVFVLCELQELTKAEAARQLSVPEGTVSSRLMRAREMLRGRLLQRGVTLGSLAALDALLVPGSVSAHLAQTAVSTAMKVALGTTLSASVSSTVLHLAQGATPAMVLSKLQMAAVGLVLATGLSVGTGYVAGGWGQEKEAAKPAVTKSAVKPKETKPTKEANDLTDRAGSKPITERNAAVAELAKVNPQFAAMFNQKISLEEWLTVIEEQSGLVSIIDQDAFRSVMADLDMKQMREQLLTLPRMNNQTTSTMLSTLLDSIRLNEQAIPATYLIRRGTLVIVPKSYLDGAASKITVSLETNGKEMTVAAALEELSKDTGISIILDSRNESAAREIKTSTNFRNLKLINAVRLLASMADLTVINVDGALFVSTAENCRKLEEEMAKGGQ